MDFRHLCQLLHGITKSPIYLYDTESNISYSAPEALQQHAFSFFAIGEKTPSLEISIYENLVAFYRFPSPSVEYSHMILGPCWLKQPVPSDKKLLKSCLSYSNSLSLPQKDFIINCLPVFSMEDFMQLIQFCFHTFYQKDISSLDLLPSMTTPSSEMQEKMITENQFERREYAKPHNSYREELEFQNAVRSGNVVLAKALYAKPVTGTYGKLSEDPLRNQKNLLISHITILTRISIDAGVPMEHAYTMSDAFINRSELCSNILAVLSIKEESVIHFTQAIAEAKKFRHSHYVEQTMVYISNNLHFPLSLNTISEALCISPAHLSRLFHREMGMTLSDYIQKERIHAAKNMLRFSDYTYLDIATYLNFKSQSYFISVFKKHTGLTPREYRNSIVMSS